MIADKKRARAEAASWVARLHGPDRTSEVESGLKRWLAESPAHVDAFEVATEVWQETSDLPGRLPVRERGTRDGRAWPAAVAASVVCLLVAAAVFYLRDDSVTTAIGEQRTVTLSDGSRVELNTSSRMMVRYDDRVRTVVLKSGEAFFDVARHQQRPFVVIAGTHRIAALGTTFVARLEGDDLAVTLIEGRVAISGGRAGEVSATDETVELAPGQRLRFTAAAPPLLDAPPLERVTAWQSGQLMFENTPLAEAAAEFNRYGKVRIVVAPGEVRSLPVGGVFRVGDVASFARAVADSHGLRLTRRGEDIVLAR